MLGNPVCSPSLTFRARLESAGWLQRAGASAASSCRFCNKLLLLCFCATPGAFPEAGQVWEAVLGMLLGQPVVLHCQLAAEPRSWHNVLGMLLHSPSPQAQNQGRFCDSFIYFILFSNRSWGKLSSCIRVLCKNPTNSFKTPQLSQLRCNLGASPSSKICGMSSISWC